MNISDFCLLSKFPKQALIRHPACKRVIHSGDWQGRVKKIIEDSNGGMNSAAEVKRLMKTGQVTLPE